MRRIKFHVQCPFRVVMVDQQRIQQVLVNLLSNACKFTPDEGVIEVRAWVKSNRLTISVRDSGCGIAEEDQFRLFRDFSTLKSNAHLNPNGIGLGLSICKKITNQLGGDITVQSRPNEGTIFTFHVRLEERPTQNDLVRRFSIGDEPLLLCPPEGENYHPSESENHPRILVVDD